MRILYIMFFACIAPILLKAQKSSDEEAIKITINNLFEGMKKNDTLLMRSAFVTKPIMQTTVFENSGAVVKNTDVNAFINSFATKGTIKDEKIQFTKILVDTHLATAWTDYRFYIDDVFSHCGVNAFQLVKTNNGWKINHVIDTRRKENCNF